jgi:hypothetical protein
VELRADRRRWTAGGRRFNRRDANDIDACVSKGAGERTGHVNYL